ncbi:MAG TPA: right-handed parallel beta-helix repeat-containing protein, partial [Candidatus Hydrogenedentes bacterium]|nr:right-handed parallel beta-helix repeat-containing protein [Candidatus Hydrogenedentota bacterium]
SDAKSRASCGRGAPDAPVRNLYFAGLTFAHAEWPLPEFGYVGIQAGHHGTTMDAPTFVLPGALEFSHATGCGLKRCCVAHVGACGVVFGAGCRDNIVAHCILEDIGGNGVMVGWRGDELPRRKGLLGDYSLSADWTDPRFVPRNNAVTDCTLRRCGAVNHWCVGIFDAFSDGTRIAHNLVTDMPYTGISIGFRWDESETSQRNCLVEYNKVHDVMKMLADGGAIYTLGFQPGTVLRGNLLYDVHRSAFAHGGAPNNGIFFDQGSKGYLVEQNIIYGTSGESVRYNQTGPDNLNLRENVFGVTPENRAFPHEAARKAGPRDE